MRQRLTEPDGRQTPDHGEERNRNVLITFLLVCAVTLLFVSTMPAVLVPAALSQFLSYCALGAALVATFTAQRVFVDHLTHWDQAAGFLALSTIAAAFTDTAAVGEYLSSLTATGTGATQTVPVDGAGDSP